MGTMVARGWIGRAAAADVLWQACEKNGLVSDGADAVQSTLASGLNAGEKKPHDDLAERERPPAPRTANGKHPEIKLVVNNSDATLAADTPQADKEKLVKLAALAKLPNLDYAQQRKSAAAELGVKVSVLDQEIRERRKQDNEADATLPHWKVEPWPDAVPTGALLDSIVSVFNRYIVLPKHAAEALALWILHAWTFDAGDISPFIVLKSPTKRCGKTSVLILLNWLTPRSELASNISPSAIFRYIQDVVD
jgi:hypothetical protein